MRFLLVNPYYPISETPSPPLGIAFLAGALEQAGINVKVLDFVVFPYNKAVLEKTITEFKPQIMGITCVTMTFENAMEVVRDAKSIDKTILTVMGGPHITFCAQETLANHPELDMAALGEGERTIVDISKAKESHSSFADIKGIVFREAGRIIATSPRDTLIDVDTLPMPARHHLPLGRYRALGMAVSMTTSRGCPFKCIFCVGRKMVGAKVRYRSPKLVVDEMEYLNTLNFSQINIADDLFTADKKRCTAICDEILNRGLKVRWTSFARVDTVSRELLEKMKAAGCTAVSFGIESANPEILKTIRKGITLDQVEQAVAMCKDVGIIPCASFILGLPGETQQTMQETLDFGLKLKELGLLYGFHLLVPFPGTEVREKHIEYGIDILSHDWSDYHANFAIVETPGAKKPDMDKIALQWKKEFDDYLDDIKKRVAEKKATDSEKAEIENLERIVLVYDIMMASAVEKAGSWKNGNKSVGEIEYLEQLSVKIKENGFEGHNVFDTLADALQKGNLIFRQEGDHISWQWRDFL